CPRAHEVVFCILRAMLRTRTLAPLLVVLFACGTDETVNPVASSSPSSVVLKSKDASLELRLGDGFGMTLRDAKGKTLLDTVDATPIVAGDDAKAYGALGATTHATVFKPAVIEGWDHVDGTDAPWHHATRVTSATMTASSASLDLVDPSDAATTIHVD